MCECFETCITPTVEQGFDHLAMFDAGTVLASTGCNLSKNAWQLRLQWELYLCFTAD